MPLWIILGSFAWTSEYTGSNYLVRTSTLGYPPATYRLADETYAKLLHKTSGKHVSDSLRKDLLSYYADLNKPFATRRKPKAWHELIRELDILKSAQEGPGVQINIAER